MTEHKSLLQDVAAYFRAKRPNAVPVAHTPDALPEFMQAFRDERSEQRAHIDSMTRIILDLTEQLTKEREHIKRLEAEIVELTVKKRA